MLPELKNLEKTKVNFDFYIIKYTDYYVFEVI